MNNLIIGLSERMLLVFGVLILSPLLSAKEEISFHLDAGSGHTCGIDTNSTITCWGDNNFGKSTPPSGTFLQVSTGKKHTCGVRTDNTVICWGDNKYEQSTPPSGIFLQVSAGRFHTCGIQIDNTVVCWGNKGEESYSEQDTPPTGKKNSVLYDYGQATPPAGKFSQITVGDVHGCGLQTDNKVVCWGGNTAPTTFAPSKEEYPQYWTNEGQATPPKGTFLQISAGRYHTCGIKTNNTVRCWGHNSEEQSYSPSDPFWDFHFEKFPSSERKYFRQIDAGMWHTCAIGVDEAVTCWGWMGFIYPSPPNSQCSCKNGGALSGCICTQPSFQKGTFSHVISGRMYACGIKMDNTLSCWGRVNERKEQLAHPLAAVPPPCFKVKSDNAHTITPLSYGFLYGIYGQTTKDSQFFTLDTRTLEIQLIEEIYEGSNFQALDFHPLTDQLYVVSGNSGNKRGYLYQFVHNKKPPVNELNKISKTGFNNIKGISFHPNATLWGWAQGEGLFKIENDDNNEPDIKAIELVLTYTGEIQIKDITWNEAGTTLYVVENLYEEEIQKSDGQKTPIKAKGVRLWTYSQSGEISTVCDNHLNSLGEEIEAMTTLPSDNDTLLVHFGGHENLMFGVIDIPSCQIVQKEILTNYYAIEREPKDNYLGVRSYNNVKSLAWIACQP